MLIIVFFRVIIVLGWLAVIFILAYVSFILNKKLEALEHRLSILERQKKLSLVNKNKTNDLVK